MRTPQTSWPTTRSTGLASIRQSLWCLIALAMLFLTQAAAAQLQPVVLEAESHAVRIDPPLEFLIDGSGEFSIDQIEQQASAAFRPLDLSQPYLLGSTAMWMRFDARVASAAARWRLAIPMPTLDEATLYYRNAAGQWVVQRAGDHLPRSKWAQGGRYPVFDLATDSNQTVRYYLQLKQWRMPYSVPPQIVSDAQYIENRQNEYMLIGVYFGFTLLVAALAIFNAVSNRDAAFGIFALQVLLFGCTQAVYTGMAGLYVWPQTPALNNDAAIMLTLCSAAAALWFARTVCTPKRYSRSLDLLMFTLMFVLPLAGIADIVLSTQASFLALNMLVGLSIAALVIGIGAALYEGDRDTRWVALGFAPLLISALFPLMRNLGMISSGFWTDYGRIIAAMMEMPILFYGLWRRVSQTRNLSTRTTALRNTDPLTGLYSTKVLISKLRKSLATGERYQLPFALLVINLANLAGLQKQHGRETADRALVMGASRISGIAHSNDTLARVGDSQFALLLEGPLNMDAANDVATKILASGLRPSNQLPDAEPLMFHIAVGHMGNGTGSAASQAEARLAQMLQTVRAIDDGSGKAIRQVRF